MHNAEIIIHEPLIINNKDFNISPKYPLIFTHIPKTAGQSVNDVLGIDSTRKGHKDIRELQSKLDPDIYNNYKKFGIIRNPFDRLVSLYSYRVRDSNGQVQLNIGGSVGVTIDSISDDTIIDPKIKEILNGTLARPEQRINFDRIIVLTY